MAQESLFRGVINFFGELGIYDIVLPFILVFTIVFAILEKTKILGLQTIDGTSYTKKNLNAMVALIIAFLVIASTQLVSIINQVMAHVVLLLVLAISFLLLVGVFFADKEFSLKEYPGWVKFFMVIMFIGIVLIFLNALDWLKYIFALFVYWDTAWASSIIFVIVIVIFMYLIVRDPTPAKTENKNEEKK